MGILISGTKNRAEKESFAPTSSFIEVVAYDASQKAMDITFKTGTKIRYINVSPSTFLSFKKSPTHSSFYARAIKGNIQSEKIIDAGIGTQSSSALKKITKEQPLDRGLKSEQSRDTRIAGTVARALNAAAAS